jgi:hypothetical protein
MVLFIYLFFLLAKLVARLLATSALWLRSQTSKIQNGKHKQRSGQHSLACQKKKVID